MVRDLAYAKINVNLKIKGNRNDGYHDLESLMVPISLCDTLEFYDSDMNMDIVSSNVVIYDNIMYKAIKYIKETYNINKYVRIVLTKCIPISSGLGGGSADLSATLRGLNRFWNLGLTLDQIGAIAVKFGSDTLFTTYNTPAIVKGRGDIIEFTGYTSKKILLLNPVIKVDTATVFKEYKETDFSNQNDLEMALLRLYPKINEFKKYYEKQGLKLNLSGSGATYFAIIDDDTRYIPNPNYLEIVAQTLE